jgi:hypothetical protein
MNDFSLDNIIWNGATVSSSTFGVKSSAAKYSNIGVKSQASKGEGNTDPEEVNKANHVRGSGGNQNSNYLNNAQNEFISETGRFSEEGRRKDEQSDDSIRPIDAKRASYTKVSTYAVKRRRL